MEGEIKKDRHKKTCSRCCTNSETIFSFHYLTTASGSPLPSNLNDFPLKIPFLNFPTLNPAVYFYENLITFNPPRHYLRPSKVVGERGFQF